MHPAKNIPTIAQVRSQEKDPEVTQLKNQVAFFTEKVNRYENLEEGVTQLMQLVQNQQNHSSEASQCPISRAQCEKLLAFLNSGTTGTGTALGDTHHAANASISCMATGAGGVSSENSRSIGSSSQSQVNPYPVFNPTLMSDPFVTPISIPDVPIESCPPCNPLVSSSQPSSTSSLSPNPPCAPLVASNSIDTAISVPNIPSADPPPTRKSTRAHKTPVYLQDYACNSATISPSAAQQNASLHQGEIHLANQICSQLQVDQGIDQTDVMVMIEAMPHHDQVLDSMQ
nr:hypothetical protein CFP56_39335 [Quercus suber]